MRVFAAAIGVSAAAACLPRAPIVQHVNAPTRQVTGCVENLDTKAGVPRAEVMLVGPMDWRSNRRKTDGNGCFHMPAPDVDDHVYRMKVIADGYDVADVVIPDPLPKHWRIRLYPQNSRWRDRGFRTKWREATAGTLHVISNTDETDTRETVAELELFRGVLRDRSGSPVPLDGSDRPLTVYALRSEADLREMLPAFFRSHTASASGLFRRVDSTFEIFLVVGERDEGGTLPNVGTVVRHELHHAYNRRPSAPPWLVEGAAELWSTARLRNGKIRVGQILVDEAMALRSFERIPLRQMLAVGPHSPEYREHRLKGRFYVESKLLVHYLRYELPDGPARIAEYEDLVADGGDPEDSFTKIWGNLDAVSRGFREYVDRGRFRSEEIALPPIVPAALTFTDMSEERIAEVKAAAAKRGQFPP